MDIGYGHTRRSGRSGTARLLTVGEALTEAVAGTDERYRTGARQADSERHRRCGRRSRQFAPAQGAVSAPVCGDSVKRRRRARKL
jgi:hypothetical protein